LAIEQSYGHMIAGSWI